jgi:ribosome-associated translation inhibitor RaiA
MAASFVLSVSWRFPKSVWGFSLIETWVSYIYTFYISCCDIPRKSQDIPRLKIVLELLVDLFRQGKKRLSMHRESTVWGKNLGGQNMGSADFYIDYETEVTGFTDDERTEIEEQLRKLASEDDDIVGAAVAVTAPGRSEKPFLYQARIVLYARPEDIAAVKKDETLQGAIKEALSAVTRQVREKREKLGEPWKRKDLPGNPS